MASAAPTASSASSATSATASSKMLSQLKKKLSRFTISRDEGPVCDSGIYCYGERRAVIYGVGVVSPNEWSDGVESVEPGGFVWHS